MASCSQVVGAKRGGLLMEVKMVVCGGLVGGPGALIQQRTVVRFDCARGGIKAGISKRETRLGLELKVNSYPVRRALIWSDGRTRNSGAVVIARCSIDRAQRKFRWSGETRNEPPEVAGRSFGGGRGPSRPNVRIPSRQVLQEVFSERYSRMSMKLKVDCFLVRKAFVRSDWKTRNSGDLVTAQSSYDLPQRAFRWSDGRRNVLREILLAGKFGGERRPSRLNVRTPRRQVQEEESSSDEPVRTEDVRDDSFTRSVEVLHGHNGDSNHVVPEDGAAQLLQDQFNRFAAAVALGDKKMAEDIISEMGSNSTSPSYVSSYRDGEFFGTSSLNLAVEDTVNSVLKLEVSNRLLDGSIIELADETDVSDEIIEGLGGPVRVREVKQYVDDVTDLGRELERLYDEVQRMVDDGDEETALQLMEANYETLLEQLDEGVQGVEQAAMLDVLAQLYMNMGEFEYAEVLLEKVSVVLKNLVAPQPLLDSILEHVAGMYTAIGKPKEAIPLYVRSLDIQRNIYGEDNPLLESTMLGLAQAYGEEGEGARSIELYHKVLVMMERAKGREDESLIIPLTHLGHMLLEEERIKEAESVFMRTVMVTTRAYGAEDGRVGVATCALARAKIAQGQVDEAVQLFRQGLELMDGCRNFSADDPVIQTVRTDLAEILNYLKRDDEAQELWEDILLTKENILGKNDIELIPHLTNAATSYAHSGNFVKAEKLFRRSLKLMTIHYGPRAPEISVPLEMLATSLHHLGRGLEAESFAREAVSIREGHFGEDHPNTGQSYNCLAAILHGLKKDDEAEKLLKKVLRIQERELGPDSHEIILTLELLAMLFNEQGRSADLQRVLNRIQRLDALLNEELARTGDFDES